jgi:hypothetical protein
MLVAFGESRSPRPPVRVAGLTRRPGPQISETRRLWHQLREYGKITVPSLFQARGRADWAGRVEFDLQTVCRLLGLRAARVPSLVRLIDEAYALAL